MHRKTISRTCRCCQNTFALIPSRVRRDAGIFCSRKCYRDFKRRQVKCVCLNCSKSFMKQLYHADHSKQHFCSMSCRNQFWIGKAHPRWRGGRGIDCYGYIQVNDPKRGRVYEHTLIAERVLGRRLKPKEIVHHINGKRTDNQNSNLLVCLQGYHQALHGRMSQLYQREHFPS